jgi:antirestriction protein ArdC
MTERTDAPAAWSALLADAVARPGLISEAYSRFWNYSFGNQLLALWQCALREIDPGPINTFLKWKDLGRAVKKGEKAITLCMPVTVKVKAKAVAEDLSELTEKGRRTLFVYKPHWFVLAQTEGKPYEPQELPQWSEDRALASLKITRIPFTQLDGNTQGFARERSVSISPIAFAPHRTLLHELAHVVLGHTAEADMTDDERTPRNIREVEAEGVALICCESLGLPGADHSRGYLQHWLRNEVISDRAAQRIFKAADTILRAGRPHENPSEREA